MLAKEKTQRIKDSEKLSKKQQKKIKIQEKQSRLKQKQKEIQKKQFNTINELKIIDIQTCQKNSIIVKNKKVSDYCEQLKQIISQGLTGTIVGIGKNIPKAISVIEATKFYYGYYEKEEIKKQTTQLNQIGEDNNKIPVMILTLNIKP